jgi:hypothetical protein
MRTLLEAVTVAFSLAAAAHAVRTRGRDGGSLVLSLLLLGAVRENLVAIREWLYGFAPTALSAGRAPLIAAVIWMYSIVAAVSWAERTGAPPLERGAASAGLLARVAVFMVALAGFYEPVLARFGMARWEEGTVLVAGVPAIAAIGYPTLAVAEVALWARLARRPAALAAATIGLAVAHAWGLVALKRALGW